MVRCTNTSIVKISEKAISLHMKKIIALDLGDQWVGIAISDILQMLAKPYITVPAHELVLALTTLFKKEALEMVVVGYPKTMKGTHSKQTEKVLEIKDTLEKTFPEMQFILWDERLSSKRADLLSHKKTKEAALQSHARAAAFILDSYLTFKRNQQNQDENS